MAVYHRRRGRQAADRTGRANAPPVSPMPAGRAPGAVSGGLLPDLRRAPSLQDAGVWRETVRGARAANGMPDFSRWVSDADAEAVRAYVAGEARGLYAEEGRR